MSENQRLAELQKILGFRSQAEFAAALGIKQGSLSDIYRGKNGIGVSAAIKSRLFKDYSINIDWVETGAGSMYVENSGTQKNVNGNNIQAGQVVYGSGEAEYSERREFLALLKKKDEQLDRLITVIEGFAKNN